MLIVAVSVIWEDVANLVQKAVARSQRHSKILKSAL